MHIDPLPESARRRPRRPLLVSLIAVAVGSAVLYAITYAPFSPDRGAPSLTLRLITYPLLFALYFIAVFIIWRRRERAAARVVTVTALVAAVAFRAIVLSGPVAKNADNWRYLWEGKVLLSGMNPYAAPPADARYDGVRAELEAAGDDLFDHLLPKLNDVRSVYGPIATGIFTLPHLLPVDRIWALRAIMSAFDLGTMLVLMGLLRSLGRAPALALIYAWNPMCLCGFADRGQIDAPMVFLVALAAWLICARRPGWSGVVLAAALLVKISPLLLVLPFARVGRLRFAAPLAGVALLGAVPFALAGPGSLSGFQAFATLWHNMDSIHALILAALWPARNAFDVSAAARLVAVLASVAYAVWRTFRGTADNAQWLLEASAHVSAAALLFSPVVHPWYTAHMLVFLCFAPSPGLLLLTCATMAWFLRFWEPKAGGLAARLLSVLKEYREPWRWVAYPPVFIALIVTWLRARLARAKPSPPSSC